MLEMLILALHNIY